MTEVATVCRQNLSEEQAMAKWLETHIVEMTLIHLRNLEQRAAA